MSDEYEPSGILFRDGPLPKLRGRVTKQTLEHVATALLRFHKRTGRRCPNLAERKEMMVGSDSLESLAYYFILSCKRSEGFTLYLFGRDARTKRMLFLGNGCRSTTIYQPTGPFLPARPDPVIQDRHRSAALSRELLDCMIAPFVTVTVCDGDDTENCTDTNVEDWLAGHPE